MTPLEGVARALCRSAGLDPDLKFKSSDWGPETAPHELAWHEFLPMARASLTAIRSEAAELSGDAYRTIIAMRGESETQLAQAVFEVMIDGALAEEG